MGKVKISDEEFLKRINEKKDQFYKIAISYVLTPEDALDVIQESTCKAYVKKHTLKNPEYFNTWFIRILINTAIDISKKNKKYLPLVEEEQAIVENETDESQYDLLEALKILDPKYKSVIVLKFYEDLTFKEIGQVLKKPENTVKTIYYKALKTLKGVLNYEQF